MCDTIHVVELKKPEYIVRARDFVQLSGYVGFIKSKIGNNPNNIYKSVAGYLVVGERYNDPVVMEMTSTYEKSRYYIRTYQDLVVSAQHLHSHFRDKLVEFEKHVAWPTKSNTNRAQN